ncbi:MAG: tetratricopeptide repeat protein [Planctomycetota bacterium]|nr:tetratricopeptide repeat protein [Planctomycetota bacterium]
MPEEGLPPTRLPAWAWLLFVVATVAAFAPGLTGAFVWDDLTLVARDANLRDLGALGQIVSQPLWSGLPELGGDPDLAPGHWRPLTSLTFAIGFALGGGATHTLPFHLISLALHLGASLVVFRILRRLVSSPWGAYLGALAFALHTVHVESVTWIAAVNDPLFGLFGLLSLNAWLAWRERGSSGLPLMGAVWLLLALGAKEVAVAVPAMILVVDLLLVSGRRRSLAGWGALAGAVAVWIALRMAVFGELAAGFLRGGAETGTAGRGLMLRLEMLGHGLVKLLFPVGLSPFRPFTEEGFTGWPLVQVVLALVLFAGLLALALSKGWRRLGAALLLAAAGLLPALVATGATGQTPYADRYVYLSVLGLSLGLAAVASLAAFQTAGKPPGHPTGRALLGPALLVVALGFQTPMQAGVWRSPEVLFRHGVTAFPDYPMVHWQLGEILRQRYLETGDEAAFYEAGERYDRALDLLEAAKQDPSIPRGEYDYLQANLGKAWWFLIEAEVDGYGEYDTAATIFEMLLEEVYKREEWNARTGGTMTSLPIEQVLTGLGICNLAANKRTEAMANFKLATSVNALYAPPWHNLGVMHFEAGEYEQASFAFSKALELKPGDVKTIVYQAKCLFEQGWIDRALELVDTVRDLDPASPEPDLLHGGASARKRDWRAALVSFDAAIARAPRSAMAHYHRGVTLYQMQKLDEASASLRRACELNPEHFEAHYNLGGILLELGANDKAQAYLERAYSAGTGRPELPAMRQVLYELDPAGAQRLRALADLDEARGDLVGALYFTERALVLDRDSVRSLHLKGRILLENGDPGGAVLELERAVELAPGGYAPHQDLGRAYMQLGRYPKARTALETARSLLLAKELPGRTEEERDAARVLQDQLVGDIDLLLERLP